MTFFPLILALTLVAAPASTSPATRSAAATGTPPTTQSSDEGVAVLGLRLEGVDYPYPVEIYKFESQANDLEMAYMDVAPTAGANGRTVVLLHGKNFNGDYWGQTARDLAAAGFRVVVPDQIGFGKSSKPQRYQFTFQQLATNTAALLDSIGVQQVEVVGHSMGGMLATRFALMYPDRVSRLALVDPIGLEDWKLVVPYQTVDTWYLNELDQSYASIKQYQLASYYDGRWNERYERPLRLLAGMTRSPDWPKMAWDQALTYDMIFTQPVVYEFGDLTMPTLVMVGTRDRTALGKSQVGPEVRETMGRYDQLGRKTADAIPDAKLVELDGVGHLPMLEAYDRYLPPLRDFLEAGQ